MDGRLLFGGALAASIVIAIGCDGVIMDPRGEGGGGSGGSGGGTDPASEPLRCDADDLRPAEAPLRRLTPVEYENTVRDLFPGVTLPEVELVASGDVSGFDNNADGQVVSPLLIEQYQTAAASIGAAVSADRSWLPCDPAADEVACGREVATAVAEGAYRRPLTAEERARIESFFDSSRATFGFDDALAMVVEGILQSPTFLYRPEVGTGAEAPEGLIALGPWEIASRLSYLLWQTAPDEDLRAAAAAGELSTPAQLEAHARRMLDDPRAEPVVQRFFDEWLQLRELEHMEKNTELHPDYRPELAELFRQETHAFVREVFENENADFRELLTADWTMANAELAAFYGASGPAGEGFERVPLDGMQRAGLLTQAGFLAMNAKPEETSPTHRGMFVRAGLLCGDVPPPPPGVDPIAPDPDPSMTMRERLNEHRADPVCASCHDLMDPLGFGFEAFDAVGQWRDTEAGRPVDDSGELHDTDVDGEFDGAVDLAHRLADSDQVQGCMARQWFRYAHGRNEHDLEDNCSVDQLTEAFQGADLDIRELIVALTQTDAFLYTRVEDAE